MSWGSLHPNTPRGLVLGAKEGVWWGAAGTVGRGDGGGQHQNLGALTLELVPVQQVGENGTASGEKQVESVDSKFRMLFAVLFHGPALLWLVVLFPRTRVDVSLWPLPS